MATSHGYAIEVASVSQSEKISLVEEVSRIILQGVLLQLFSKGIDVLKVY